MADLAPVLTSDALARLIGERLRMLRRGVGETQRVAGNAVGVSTAALCNYERGNRFPPMEVLLLLVRHYGAHLSDVISEADYA